MNGKKEKTKKASGTQFPHREEKRKKEKKG